MGRRPLDPEKKTSLQIGFKIRNKDLLAKLNNHASREIITQCEVINRSLEQYLKNDDDGRQTTLGSFTPEGLKSLNQLELACLHNFETRPNINRGEVVYWLQTKNIPPKQRVEMSSRVIRALLDGGVIVEQ